MTSVIFNQTIAVLKPRLIDSPLSTEPVEDWEDPIVDEVDFKVSIQPASSSEGPVERPQTITSWRLITPPGADIPDLAADSKILVGGLLRLDVVGKPARWPNPWLPGQVHHLEADLEEVRG